MDPVASLTPPTSFRLAVLAQNAYEMPLKIFESPAPSHPSLSHLCLLVFEAVLEVVCVSLPGYIVARLGQFDVDKQKFLANLNVMLFTPCLSMLLSLALSPLFSIDRDLTHHSLSLHQASVPTQCRKAIRSSHYSGYIYCTNARIMGSFHPGCQRIPIQ
jgi:hypothetical protein